MAVPHPLSPTQAPQAGPGGARSSVVTLGRISSLALLKLGINRGLICIKHALQREGSPFSPRWCGHSWDTEATDRHLLHITPQHSASSDGAVRGVLVSRESPGELGVVPALGSHCSRTQGHIHILLHVPSCRVPMGALPPAVLCVYGAFKVIPIICFAI